MTRPRIVQTRAGQDPAVRRRVPEEVDAEWIAERRELWESVVVPEVVATARERWPEATVTLSYGSVGQPVLDARTERERRSVRWIVKVRSDGDMSRAADLELSWPHDAELHDVIESLHRTIWGAR